MTPNPQITCPLCSTDQVEDYCRDKRRDYLRCRICGLIFVPASQHLSAEAEKQRYDLHRNAPPDPGYRSFLNRLFVPLRRQLPAACSGLDFGSGPEPVLARMFENAGCSMAIYDQYYAPVPGAFEKQYDFITATEVVEHLRDPKDVLTQLWSCLKPGGLLGIMTRPAPAQEAFPAWPYKNDLTHICFFSHLTFARLARGWNAELVFPEDDIAVFRKGPLRSCRGQEGNTPA